MRLVPASPFGHGPIGHALGAEPRTTAPGPASWGRGRLHVPPCGIAFHYRTTGFVDRRPPLTLAVFIQRGRGTGPATPGNRLTDRHGAKSGVADRRPRQMMKDRAMTAVLDSADPDPASCRRVRERHPPGLSRVRLGDPARPALRLSGVFRPARGRLRVPAITRAADRGGPRSIWRYAPLLPVPADIATFRSTDPGFTRLVDARHLADDLGLRPLWVKDDSGNPTHSFKDRVVAVALSAARELGLQVLACPSTGNLANAVAAAAARAGIRSVVFVPQNLEQPKIIASAVYGTTLVAVAGQLRRHEQAGQRDRRRGGGLGVRQRQRPALLRRGLQDAGLRDRRAAGLAAAGPGRGPGGQRVPADQDRQGLRELVTLGLVEDKPYRSSAPRPPGAPRWRRRTGPAGLRRPVKPDTIAKSLAIGNPADGPYVLDVVRRTGGAVADIDDETVVPASSGWPGPRASSPRPPAA